MSFYEQYELLDNIRNEAVKTFNAREKATGRPVAIHLLPGGKRSHGPLLDRLDRSDSLKCEVIARGEYEGTVFVVTEPWTRMGSFGDWVMSAESPTDPGDTFVRQGSWRVPTAEFGKKAAQPTEPGEFTRMFLTPQGPKVVPPGPVTAMMSMPLATPPTPEPPGPKPPADPEPESPEPGTPVSKPGLFTSMFRADQIKALTEQKPDPRPAAPAPRPAPEMQRPGEF